MSGWWFQSKSLQLLKKTKHKTTGHQSVVLGYKWFQATQMKLRDNKMTLVGKIFSPAGFKNLTGKELNDLSPMAIDFFHFIDKFAKLHNIKSKVVIHMLEDLIQKTETDTCGVFQLYFYENLFELQYDSTIMLHEKLTNNTTQTLLAKTGQRQ